MHRRCLLLCLPVLLGGGAAFAAEVAKSVVPATITTIAFQSESLGEQRFFNVLLPPDYDKSTSRYPVLYLLHGYGDDHTAWSYMTNLSHYAARYQMIIVMPDGSKSFYVNSAADPKAKFEDFIIKDLIPYVDSQFRTIPLPRARAVAGLSMGGYGAAFLGLKHWRRFAAFGSFSGAIGISHEMPRTPANAEAAKRTAQMQAMFGPQGSPERVARDPFALLEKVPLAEMPMIYIACGGQDFLVAQNRSFVQLLAEKKVPYEYRETSPHAHSWDVWDDQIRIFLEMISGLPGFRQH
jgi:S-formylglutathione hydrolase FrmB